MDNWRNALKEEEGRGAKVGKNGPFSCSEAASKCSNKGMQRLSHGDAGSSEIAILMQCLLDGGDGGVKESSVRSLMTIGVLQTKLSKVAEGML